MIRLRQRSALLPPVDDDATGTPEGLRLSDAYVRAALVPSEWPRRSAALRAIRGYVVAAPADTVPAVARARLVGLIGMVVADNAARIRQIAGFAGPAVLDATRPTDDLPFADVAAARCLTAVLNGAVHDLHRITEDLAAQRGAGALVDVYVAAVEHLAGTLAIEAAR